MFDPNTEKRAIMSSPYTREHLAARARADSRALAATADSLGQVAGADRQIECAAG